MMSTTLPVAVQELVRTFRDLVAVDRISFEVRQGECHRSPKTGHRLSLQNRPPEGVR